MFTGPIEATDGRRRRSDASRARIVEAMLALVQAGDVTPSADAVAARAGVGLRTVFRHFRDMETLYAEMSKVMAARLEAMVTPLEGADWRARVRALAAFRLGVFEGLLPFKRAEDVHRHESPSLQAHQAGVLRAMRGRLERLLPAAFVGAPERMEALDLWLSLEAWQRLRGPQGLDEAGARALVMAAVERLIDDWSGDAAMRISGAMDRGD